MNLPSVKNLPVVGKKILLRTNYDVPLTKTGQVADKTRIEESLPTINYLLSNGAKLIILSHLGRPQGEKKTELSLKPVVDCLAEFLGEKVPLVSKLQNLKQAEAKLVMVENLRFWPQEEAGVKTKAGLEFAEKLASLANAYVNDAFAVSHRSHASIVGVPRFVKSVLGLDFLKEIEVLSKIKRNPQRPIVVILGGKKKSKIRAVKKLVDWADDILVGGKLVEYDGIPKMVGHQKVVGSLTKNKEDITMETIKKFEKMIKKAKTIIWSGPLGIFEDQEFEQGTRVIARAVVESGAYSVIGGGDTEAALTKFGLVEKVDYVSSGGGAMLTYLAEGTLPGIEAILKAPGNHKNG